MDLSLLRMVQSPLTAGLTFNLGRGGGSDDPTTAIIQGRGSQWDVLDGISIGGNLTIRDGGLLRSGNSRRAVIGGKGQPGLVIVEGAGSVWEQFGPNYIENGTQIVRAGGRVSATDLEIGRTFDAAAFNQLIVDGLGSEFATDSFSLGGHGNNTSEVRLTDGGKLRVGGFAAISGLVALDGIGTELLGGAQTRVEVGIQNQAEISIRMAPPLLPPRFNLAVSATVQRSRFLVLGHVGKQRGWRSAKTVASILTRVACLHLGLSLLEVQL